MNNSEINVCTIFFNNSETHHKSTEHLQSSWLCKGSHSVELNAPSVVIGAFTLKLKSA